MGVFDNLFGSAEKSSLTAQEAFAGILMGASGCDGQIADEEVGGLITTLLRMKLYQRFGDKHYHQMLSKLHGVLKRKGVDVLIGACVAALPDDLRETAFANACDIVLADGVVEDDEKEFLNEITRKLDIAADRAKKIVKVMVIKNRG